MLDLTRENNNAHVLPSCLRQSKEKCKYGPSFPPTEQYNAVRWTKQSEEEAWIEKGMGHQHVEEPILTRWAVARICAWRTTSLYFWSSMRASESCLHRYASRVDKATRSI
jgi:hypothetical protein